VKTTLDLPDALVKEVKIRAIHEGKKLKVMFADLLRRGLAAERVGELQPPMPAADEQTGTARG